ncbi:kinase non-catalytic C-lobe domain-containing protein 1 [Dunckerocampus dactyliophorus]|uniref:kinase non-catalytic C-lobe domain-containing protein 1 n=1 Tax=Dunckerocampus dactyliophorus TaxID=161453 RepID=UPI002407230A|nr:kinase non-catalytic C-lobe domain-containing protein 1 [Dunckerocampus dactyliophorus]
MATSWRDAYYEMDHLPPLLEDEENVSLADILSLRDSCLSEEDVWAVCAECVLALQSIRPSHLFHTLCITPDTLAFNAHGNVCFMEQLSDDPEGLFVPPEFDSTGSTFEGHVFSLGCTLSAAVNFVIEPELESELEEETRKLLEKMQQKKPEDRPLIQDILSVAQARLNHCSSAAVCRKLSSVGRRVLSIESVSNCQDGQESPWEARWQHPKPKRLGSDDISKDLTVVTCMKANGLSRQQVCVGWDSSLWDEDADSADRCCAGLTEELDCRSHNSSPVRRRAQQRFNRVRGALNRSCSVPDSNNPPCATPPPQANISVPVSDLTEIGAEEHLCSKSIWSNKPKKITRGRSCESYPRSSAEDCVSSVADYHIRSRRKNEDAIKSSCYGESHFPYNKFKEGSPNLTSSWTHVDHEDEISKNHKHCATNNYMTKSMLFLNEEWQDEWISLRELLTRCGLKLMVNELWALCYMCLSSLQTYNDFPAYLSLDTVHISCQGEVLFLRPKNFGSLDEFYLAPEYQEHRIVTEKACVYGVAAILWATAKSSLSPSQKLAIPRKLKRLLLEMANSTPIERPSIAMAKKSCCNYLSCQGTNAEDVWKQLISRVHLPVSRHTDGEDLGANDTRQTLYNETLHVSNGKGLITSCLLVRDLMELKRLLEGNSLSSDCAGCEGSPVIAFNLLKQQDVARCSRAVCYYTLYRRSVEGQQQLLVQVVLPENAQEVKPLLSLPHQGLDVSGPRMVGRDVQAQELEGGNNFHLIYCTLMPTEMTTSYPFQLLGQPNDGLPETFPSTATHFTPIILTNEGEKRCNTGAAINRACLWPPNMRKIIISLTYRGVTAPSASVLLFSTTHMIQSALFVLFTDPSLRALLLSTDMDGLDAGITEGGDHSAGASDESPYKAECRSQIEKRLPDIYEKQMSPDCLEKLEDADSLISEQLFSYGPRGDEPDLYLRPIWALAFFGEDCFKPEVIQYALSLGRYAASPCLDVKAQELQQQLTIETKTLKKTWNFYQKLIQHERINKGSENKVMVSKLKSQFEELRSKVIFLDDVKKYLETQIVDQWGLDMSLLPSLATCERNTLTLQGSEDASILSFVTCKGKRNLQAGTPIGLMAYLYARNAALEGYIQQFLYTYRFFCTPEQLLQFLMEKFISAVREGPDRSENSTNVFHRSLDLLHLWIMDCKLIDFTPKSSIVDVLEKFLHNEVIPVDSQGEVLLAALHSPPNTIWSTRRGSHFGYDADGQSVCIQSYTEDLDKKWRISTASMPKEKAFSIAAALPVPCYSSVVEDPSSICVCHDEHLPFSQKHYIIQHVAQQLTLLQQDIFQRCHPVHFLNSRISGIRDKPSMQTDNGSPQITSAKSTHEGMPPESSLQQLLLYADRVTKWIAGEIVSCESVKTQAALLTKYLWIGKHSYESRNFATAMQVLGGLENMIVRQLPAWKHLSSKMFEILDELRAVQVFLKSDDLCLMGAEHTRRRPTLPSARILAMHIQQREIGAFMLTNGSYKWTKLRSIAKVVSQIHAFQEVPFTYSPDQDLQAYLRCRITRLGTSDIHLLAADSDSNFEQSTERQTRKVQDTLKRVKASLQ